jgi:hypothetical protein
VDDRGIVRPFRRECRLFACTALLDELALQGVAGDFDVPLQARLFLDAGDIGANGLRAAGRIESDLLDGRPSGDGARDLQLALRQGLVSGALFASRFPTKDRNCCRALRRKALAVSCGSRRGWPTMQPAGDQAHTGEGRLLCHECSQKVQEMGMITMKELTTLLGSVLLVIASGARADAGTNVVYCVSFSNFCDGLELSISGTDNVVTGYWKNTECAGTEVGVRGRLDPTSHMISVSCPSFDLCPGGLVWLFKLKQSSHTFNLLGWDGVNPPFAQQLNQPYTMSPGACSFAENARIPSTLVQD